MSCGPPESAERNNSEVIHLLTRLADMSEFSSRDARLAIVFQHGLRPRPQRVSFGIATAPSVFLCQQTCQREQRHGFKQKAVGVVNPPQETRRA
ncbi:hypothetical protein MTO96_003703 [Rhipicephalus appendiculatus]